MLSCWCVNYEKRPLFNVLETKISEILGRVESEHYIGLNEPYLRANEMRFKSSGETDYVALLGSPDCQAPAVPYKKLTRKYSASWKSSASTPTATNKEYFSIVRNNKEKCNEEIPLKLQTFRPNN